MEKAIKSVLLIDNNDIDNYINRTILKLYGISEIVSFTNTNDALLYLKSKPVKYQLILIDIYFPIMNGFEFIDKFNELGLFKTQGKICILSASINPLHRKIAAEKHIPFIEKPLAIKKLQVSY